MTSTGMRSNLSATDRIKVVTDTNVLVSGLIGPGNERRVMELGALRLIDVFLSQHILNELTNVLTMKLHRSPERTERETAAIRRWATIVEPSESVSIISRKPSDNRILECCLEAGADYLITGDKRDLLPLASFHGTVIVNAAGFLGIFDALSN